MKHPAWIWNKLGDGTACCYIRQDIADDLFAALEPFIDLRAQNGAWGIIDKNLDGFAPVTVTVTKQQMLSALAAFKQAAGVPA